MKPVSCTTFIKNNQVGGFALWESMATMLALPIEEFVVLDLGSDDGTLEYLREIATNNSRVRLERGEWPLVDGKVDAHSFALVMNQAIDLCKTEVVIPYQADEVFAPKLLDMTVEHWEQEKYFLSYWRFQIQENFQKCRWFPHLICRCFEKGKESFCGDGMNIEHVWDATLVSTWNGGWFQRWGEEYRDRPHELPTDEMVNDCHANFSKNMTSWKKLHAPFWAESGESVDGIPCEEFDRRAAENPLLSLITSPYWLPPILRGCVGMGQYKVRPELIQSLCEDRTAELVRG